ncbi:MAG: hypothetical protein D8B38_01315 [Candidatus Saccharimonas sp.]|jgi:hypothetical protein cdivTM_30108|nr:MAG: hypothetical protein D8B38_01315 [Candidatus Saccharimonas sp.]
MNIIKKIALSTGVCSVVIAGMVAPSASALSSSQSLQTFAVGVSAQDQVKKGIDNAGGTVNNFNIGTAITNIINIMLYALGAIAVIMIVVGGIRYTTSNGDSNGIQSAKNTILYAVAGLVVAILAYAIVNFVVSNLLGSGGGQSTPTAQYNYV